MPHRADVIPYHTPPTFMLSCLQCCDLIDDLYEAFGIAAANRHYDGALRVQIVLARHVAEVHPDEVPPPHTDGCKMCARYEALPEDAVFWREHLARGLFLPEEMARLM